MDYGIGRASVNWVEKGFTDVLLVLCVILLALEEEASTKSVKATTIRTSSNGERRYLGRLIDAHGMDFEAMARDRKRNAQQYSVGQLRRAIEKAGM